MELGLELEVLKRAAAMVRVNGWVQGRGQAEDGRICVVRAIVEAGEWLKEDHKGTIDGAAAAGQAVKRLKAVIGGQDPVRWNDAPERTEEEVLKALEEAQAVAS